MAVRQYIGARYVPKFYEGSNGSQWDSGVMYEPLIIVGYLTNYYVSKKTVPATVGAPNLNPDYWANIGLLGDIESRVTALQNELDGYETQTDTHLVTLDGQVTNLQNELDGYETQTDVHLTTLDGEVKEIKTNIGGKYLFIGDSYAESEYGNWIEKAADMLGLGTGEYWNLANGGSSLSGGDWLTYLQNWVSNNPTEIENIGTIVCGGGINDSSSGAIAILYLAIETFMNYCKTTFGNSIKVKFFYFGWALNESPVLYGRNAVYRAAAQAMYARVAEFGGEYITGGECVLHNRQYLTSDGLHPNSNGGDVIAEVVANGCKVGSSCVNYFNTAQITFANGGVGNQGIAQYMFGVFNMIKFNHLEIEWSTPIAFASGGYTDIGTVALPFGNEMPPIQCSIQMTSNGTYDRHTCLVRIFENKLQIAVIDWDANNSTYVSVPSCTKIWGFELTSNILAMYD